MSASDDKPAPLRRLRIPLAAVLVIAAAVAIGALGTRGGSRDIDGGGSSGGGVSAHAQVVRRVVSPSSVTLRIGSDPRRIPTGFLGISMEFPAVRAYTGTDPSNINPVLLALIRNLSPGQRPQLRIGGNSTDDSYVLAPGVGAPRYLAYRLTPSWMATTAALAHDLDARMTLGVNLAANRPALAAAEARDYMRALGPGSIRAIEIGNEPNVYHNITTYRTPSGRLLHARPTTFGYPAYRSEFQATAKLIGSPALAGPALAAGPSPGNGSWVHTVSDFLAKDPRVGELTVHRYPLRNCYVPPSSPQYPTIAHLLSPFSTTGLAQSVQPWLAAARRQHRQLRLDELNSVACEGRPGVSNTFASALWMTDALFALVNAGVDGVDVHTLPGAAYQLFAFGQRDGAWYARVPPVYYGLMLFAQAAPPGSELVDARAAVGSAAGLSDWATRDRDGTVRVVLINESLHDDARVTVAAAARSHPVTVERLDAPGVTATTGVTLGQRSFGAVTRTGQLAAPATRTVSAGPRGGYTVTVSHASAALITIPAG